MRRAVCSSMPDHAHEGTLYRFNPYSITDSRVPVFAAAATAAREAVAAASTPPPPAMLHSQLIGKVAFYPFPDEAFPVAPAPAPKERLARVFFGQLPYAVTEMELAWMLHTVAGGAQTFHHERIVKKSARDATKKMPTGCLHSYGRPDEIEALIEAVDKRVLFDDSGVWWAEDAAQKAAMDEYCLMLKHNPALRPADRPYQPVVVQPATSTYIPNLHQQLRRRSPAGTPPPPPYGAFC